MADLKELRMISNLFVKERSKKHGSGSHLDSSCWLCKQVQKGLIATQLSLSNCKIQGINSSLKSCTELRELRLAHNEIRILSSLAHLKNLNLAGNPVAEKDVLAKKIKKLVPSLQIFNARPIDKAMKSVFGGYPSVDVGSIDVKKTKLANENASHDEETTEKKPKRKSREVKTEKEMITNLKKARHDEETENNEKREGDRVEKKKQRVKSKSRGCSAVQLLSPVGEVGLGGPSAWDVEV